MRTITLSTGTDVSANEQSFSGNDKAEALAELRKALEAASPTNLIEVEITVGYKEYRRIDIDDDDIHTPWCIKVRENGCGQEERFATREECINRFIFMCDEKGEHWD